ncbi:CDP-glycerol glycerophosphotransferase family protein [Actinacidiphila alni]|uniref:bifunctional glycosyltransferase/CDP-glycerol:glycerophosphate glycerophosphotransferase n=1 Tax=Actinacidiphila alni TaxID=380248 RepID=UPI0033DDFF59
MNPRLTVVVPVYNVEQYLEECLRSIAAQTFTDLDVVMVDDGSTDAGPDLAQAFADRDPRFRLVRQPNGGLGHARNTGARNADPGTSYLTFVDSDDVLPPRAYEKLVGLLDRSGSDFATGNVWRLTARGRSQAWQHRGMNKTVERTHITRDLGLLSDRVAWNKVFRRTFWDKHTLAFPEGVLYEDTPLTIPAHFLADAVDVLHEHVYYWRIREGSITRRRTDVKGVRDRIAAVDGVSRFLADPANTRWSAHKRDYDTSVLTDDLLYFIEALPMAGPEYHEVFLDRVRDYLSRVDPTLFPALPVELRIRWELIRQGRLEDLLEVLAHERHGGRTVFDVAGPPLRKRAAVVRRDGSPVPLPRAVTAVDAKDLPVVARLSELHWRDGKLVLSGHAYVRNVDARAHRTSLKTAVLMSGRRKLLLPVRTVRAPEVTAAGPQERHSYDWSGFEITVDPKRLRTNGSWKAAQWRLGVVVSAGSVVRPAALRADEAGAGSSPVPFPLDDDTRLVPWYKDGRLHLSVEPVTRRVTGHRADGDDAVLLEIATRDGKPPVALRARQQATGAVVDCPLTGADTASGGFRTLTARLPLAQLAAARPAVDGLPKEVAPETAATWSVEALFADGGTARISVDRPLPQGRYDLGPDALLDGAHRELVLDASAAGHLLLRDRTPQPLATHLSRATNGHLLVTGDLPAATPPDARLVLRHGTYATEIGSDLTVERPADPAAGATGAVRRFSAALDVGALPHAGRWYLHVRTSAERSDPVRIAREAMDELPLRVPVEEGARAVTVNRRFHDHLFVLAGSPVPEGDRGPYRQRMLRERRYPVLLRRPLTDTVLYSSFDGHDCADSPRAVHDELVRRGVPFDHVWVVRDRSVAVPATARSVLHSSDAWYEALARSRHVVTNTHLPTWFRRRDGQQVVQTWHGTPLKRIGQDLAGTLCADLTHMWPQPRPGQQWSLLLSPDAQSTPVLRRALGHDGEIAETGLPRTDLLSGEDRDKIREEVRERLGLPAGRTVVLYAPTIRDDEAYDAGHARLHLPVDLPALAAELSGSHVLLVRAHPLVADSVPAAPGGRGFVRDVSGHPDLAELLLAADVLVTDYSAVLVDFAVTGRPVLLFTPDLAHYRDTLRGFTFDYEERAPGPLLRTTRELTEALRDPAAAVAGHADAYAAFRAAFCHLDDGGAAARVADLMLRRGPGTLTR